MTHNNERMLFIILICFIVSIASSLFGFYTGVINGTWGGLELAFNSHYTGLSVNVASMLVSCAIGAFFAGHLADVYGRRSILLIIALLFMVSAWGSGISDTQEAFILYRSLGGLGAGAASVIVPMYIAEVAPARYRGSLGAILQVAVIIGLLVAFASNYVLVNVAGGVNQVFWFEYAAWRWMFWVELLPSFIFLVGLLFIPESPRYLVLHGQHQKAITVLTRLYGRFIGEAMYLEISLTLSEAHLPRFSDLKDQTTGRMKKVVWVGLGLAVFQQITGINIYYYYGVIFWQAVGFSETDGLLFNIILAVISLVACLFTLIFIDRWGRKIFLLVGSVGMTVSLAVLLFVFFQKESGIPKAFLLEHTDWIIIIATNAYVFFFSLSWGPVMWVLLGEMFPHQIRGSALAICGMALWSANLLTVTLFIVLLTFWGLMNAYILYTLMALLSIIFVYKYVYETKGKKLESMES
ncbi:sugar porter family MFS transporter [uncultured Shewanella sp.]|uniref:sugar porter family MFS transporter n=1 Tax=uncultured Shewanella sp. TaxID=173975 RepID=UPI0026242FFA|nr:sugar porter family MFS transporter [uncultured Shewanella sp.]